MIEATVFVSVMLIGLAYPGTSGVPSFMRVPEDGVPCYIVPA